MEVKVGSHNIDLVAGDRVLYNGAAYVLDNHKVGKAFNKYSPSLSKKIATKMIKLGILKYQGKVKGQLDITLDLYVIDKSIETIDPQLWQRRPRKKG